MAGIKTAILPFDKISRAALYVNAERRPLGDVKKQLGCDYICNAGLFDMKTYKPASGLVAGGKAYYVGESYGIAFVRSKTPVFSYKNSVNAPEWAGAYPTLLRGGKLSQDGVPSGLGGKRARTAVGIAGSSLVLACASESGGAPESSGLTLEELSNKLLALGCTDAINLDGGGSTQCDFYGDTVSSGRIVASFLCVWTEGAEKMSESAVNSGSAAKVSPPDFPGASYFGAGQSNAYVEWLGKLLISAGYGSYYSSGAGEKWSDSDRKACEAFQLDQGWCGSDADGLPGNATWTRLAKLYTSLAESDSKKSNASAQTAPAAAAAAQSAAATQPQSPVIPKNYAEKGVNTRSIDNLIPYVGYLCRKLLEKSAAAGMKLIVTGTLRDAEYQSYCKETGASSTALIGPHAFGLAFDVCLDDKANPYDSAKLKKVGELGKSLGLEWGGDWRSFPDSPHFQYTRGLSDADLRAGKRAIMPDVPDK